ncbi:hypothetical protein GF352_02600 [archaeon]|nr:hypothetical protein [archaeon]
MSSLPEPYVSSSEAITTARLIEDYFSELGLSINEIKGIEIGFGGFSSHTLSKITTYIMDIEAEMYKKYEEKLDIKLVKGDATKADLSGLDFIVSLGLPKASMSVAEKVLKNSAKHCVEYAILSPKANNPGQYELDIAESITEEKELLFYVLK